MDDERSFLIGELADKQAREQYASELLDSHIALQIKTLRQQRGWSQAELAERAGKFQSQISSMEQIDFSSWKISTLRQLANAFDLALVVRFESFGRFLDEMLPVERAALERPAFDEDPAMRGEEPMGHPAEPALADPRASSQRRGASPPPRRASRAPSPRDPSSRRRRAGAVRPR
jgi:transcriptional regulator with XRE-family HTH domain